MKILGLIPARGGSKGIIRKNIKLLNGLPLIQYTINAALKSNTLTKVIVSTEDEEIANISQELGAEVSFIRPSGLADDNSPTIDTIVHALEYYQNIGEKFDAVCLLQPTVPFRSAEDIKNAVENFTKTNADSLISVEEIPHKYNPNWAYIEDQKSGILKLANGEKEIISRRQALPKAYHRNGSIYITKSEVILNQKSLYGASISYLENKKESVINIDTNEDWTLAEKYISENDC